MIDALELEVVAIRKKGGARQVELRGGEQIGRADGTWLYRFVMPEDLNLRDDTPVRVSAGQEDVSGVLVSFRDGVLIVALEKDLEPKIPAARLIASDAFLIERLKERLEKVRSGEVEFHRPAAERVLGLVPVSTADAEPHFSVVQDGDVNPDQVCAVRRSLGSDTTFVWGPPGTGKTTTLARIVEAHYRAGHSVLLVSNTNIAVDTALERVAERLRSEPDFQQGLVIRQGPVVKEELRRNFGQQVILEKIVVRVGKALAEEKEALQCEVAPLEAEERSILAVLTKLEQLTEARRRLLAEENARHTALAAVEARDEEADRHRTTAARLRADLERARGMGLVRRFLSGLQPEKLQGNLVTAERSAKAAANAARTLTADLPKYDAELGRLGAKVERLAMETRPYPPASDMQARLAPLRTRLGQIRERVSAIDQELGKLEQQVLARCRILATTVYRTYLGKGAPCLFDAVVIDEASMLMPPLVYHAAGLATQSVTVAGDFRQLPPIVSSDEPLAAEWLKQDVFEKSDIPRRLEQREAVPYLVALGTQYRMCEPICALVNELFYDDHPLRSDPSVGHEVDRFPLSAAPLLYVDTAPFHPWAALRAGTFSRYNLLHALLIRNIVLHLGETGFLPPEGEPNDAVGVVAPYASQARLIEALLHDRLGPRAAGIAATVHRFQGNEKSVMLLDLTDSIGARLGRFLQATSREEDGARLVNVATSRAQHHLVLLGNFEYLRAKAPVGGFVHRLMDHLEEHGEPLDLDALLPLAERDWIDGLHRVLPATFDLPDRAAGAFTEGTFYPAFLQDLERACESIVIFSPFATGRGTGRWVDPLRAALARGVRVRLLTRPPEEFGGGGTREVVELVHALRELGVAVDLRARMHEKIAILDGRILWHGSLNVLSHRDTHESMLRLESPAACGQLARFVTTPAGRREEGLSLGAPENPPCPTCSGPTVWNNGRYGIYFSCADPDCDGKVDPRWQGRGRQGVSRDRSHTVTRGGRRRPGSSSTKAGRPCALPGCDGRLAERNGRFGRFLGCTNYPRCRYTENLD